MERKSSNWRTNIAQQQELCIEQRLFCNKVIEMTENCAIIVQTTIEANTFWNKRAPSITITDENKTRNASEQEKEFAWFLTTEKQTQKRDKTKYNEVIVNSETK